MQLKYHVLVDKSENPRKCTIAPLKGRPDFQLQYIRRGTPITPVPGSLLLHPQGAPMDEFLASLKSSTSATEVPREASENLTVAAIDCVWKYVPRILKFVQPPLPQLVGIPPDFVTAYPRMSKHGHDPEGGLATIEAIFIVAAFLGKWDESLLEHYYFKQKFLHDNAAQWKKYALLPQ